MDVEMENEFTQMLLKSIITGMNVPYNYIDSTSEIDFARTLTMTNNPFVRTIVNDQDEFGTFFTEVIRTLYKNEFLINTANGKRKRKPKDNSYMEVQVDKIELRFPTPIYLVLGNLNEQIQNSQQTAEFITLNYFPEDPTGQNNTYDNEKKKAVFKKKLYKNHLLPNLEWDNYDALYKEVEEEFMTDNLKQGINFAPEAKKKNELDMLEDDF